MCQSSSPRKESQDVAILAPERLVHSMAERVLQSAACRRERRIRSMWRHEQRSVRMAVANMTHYSWKAHAVTALDSATQTTDHITMNTDDDELASADIAPAVEYVIPVSLAVECAAPATVLEDRTRSTSKLSQKESRNNFLDTEDFCIGGHLLRWCRSYTRSEHLSE